MAQSRDTYVAEIPVTDVAIRLKRRRVYLANMRKRRVDALRKVKRLLPKSDELLQVQELLEHDTRKLRAIDALIDLVQLLDNREEVPVDFYSDDPELLGFGLDDKGRYPALG